MGRGGPCNYHSGMKVNRLQEVFNRLPIGHDGENKISALDVGGNLRRGGLTEGGISPRRFQRETDEAIVSITAGM